MSTIDIEVYHFLAKLVFEKIGVFYPEKDFYRLDRRINDLMGKFECETPSDLLQKFGTHMKKDMEKYLVDICTNNETYFFRDNKPFIALTSDIIPHVFELLKSETAPINIWSCASSTGQEPLSIVMSILENLKQKVNFNIKATDISSKALAKATEGTYTGLDIQRGLPVQLLLKYFDSLAENHWKAKAELLSHITYSSFNLFSDLFEKKKYHIVFCRNVLIYQNKENKAKILKQIADSLVPGGCLIMGAGESLIGIGTDLDLEQVTYSNCMIFRKK